MYIAGPMRGYKDFNFPAFYAAERFLISRGHTAFNPARRDNEMHGDIMKSESGSLDDIKGSGFCIREAMRADMSWICDSADTIFMLDGWEDSPGATAERSLGICIGCDIMYQSESHLHANKY